MKKQRFTAITAAVAITASMLTALPANAAVKEDVSNSWTFSEVGFGIGDVYGKDRETSSQSVTSGFRQDVRNISVEEWITVADDGDDNKIISVPGNTKLIQTNFNATTKSPVVKASVDFTMSDINGTLELFGYMSGWGNGNSGYGTYITDGSIYNYELRKTTGEPVLLLADAVEADKWYTIDRYMDFRTKGQNMVRIDVTDKAEGSIVYSSGWLLNANAEPYGTTESTYYTAYVRTSDFAHDAALKLDNWKYMYYTDLPSMSYGAASDNANVNNYLTYDKLGNLGICYALYDFNENDKRNAPNLANYHRWQESIMLPQIPDGAIYVDGWSSPNDGSALRGTQQWLIKVQGTEMYYNTYNLDTESWTEIRLDGITVKPDIWYDITVDYKGKIFKADADNLPKHTTADITVVSSDGETAQINNNITQTRTYFSVGQYSRGALAFVNLEKAGDVVYLDNISAKLYNDSFADEPITWYDMDFENCTLDDSLKTAISKFEIAYMGYAPPPYLNSIYYTGNEDAVIAEDCILDTGVVSVMPTDIKFIFSQPADISKINKQSIRLVSAMTEELLDGYDITPSDDGLSTVLRFTKPLDYNSMYELSVNNTLSDADYNIPIIPAFETKSWIFRTESEPENKFGVKSLKILNENGNDYPSEILSKGDNVKAEAVMDNIEATRNTALILAIYDGITLKDVIVKEDTVSVGADITIQTDVYTAAEDGLTAKAFLWNSTDGMMPLYDSIELGK